MAIAIVVAALFLLSARLLWAVIDGEANSVDGWMFAAYAIVFSALAGYRTGLGERGRRARARLKAGSDVENGGSAVLTALETLALAAVPMGLVLSLLYAPQEKTMGMVQRIFYVHVPSAWVAFLAFTVVAGASIVYLVSGSRGADRVAHASAEVGVVFTSLVLITGPVWAKPVWGIWWTWDMRLTLTLLLWLVYVGYLMLRSYVPDPGRQARLAAATGLLGFVGVPIDYMAIRWWRTQHPQPVIGGGEGSGLHPMMLTAFFYMLASFTMVYLALLLRRVTIARMEEAASE